MRVFLDANILFSGAKAAGPVATLVEMIAEAGHERVVDGFVIAEARRNLSVKYPDAIVRFERQIAACRMIETPAAFDVGRGELGWLPAKDRPVLAAAISGRCEALLTGDRTHFGAGYGRTFAGVTIHSPRSLYLLLVASLPRGVYERAPRR